MLSDTALADAARYCDNDLALVLGERLESMIGIDDELEAARQLNDELSASRDNWIEETVALQTENARLRDLVNE
jgi:hypothetical protein